MSRLRPHSVARQLRLLQDQLRAALRYRQPTSMPDQRNPFAAKTDFRKLDAEVDMLWQMIGQDR